MICWSVSINNLRPDCRLPDGDVASPLLHPSPPSHLDATTKHWAALSNLRDNHWAGVFPHFSNASLNLFLTASKPRLNQEHNELKAVIAEGNLALSNAMETRTGEPWIQAISGYRLDVIRFFDVCDRMLWLSILCLTQCNGCGQCISLYCKCAWQLVRANTALAQTSLGSLD